MQLRLGKEKRPPGEQLTCFLLTVTKSFVWIKQIHTTFTGLKQKKNTQCITYRVYLHVVVALFISCLPKFLNSYYLPSRQLLKAFLPRHTAWLELNPNRQYLSDSPPYSGKTINYKITTKHQHSLNKNKKFLKRKEMKALKRVNASGTSTKPEDLNSILEIHVKSRNDSCKLSSDSTYTRVLTLIIFN